MGDLQTLSENLIKWVLIAGAAGLLVPASTDTLTMFTPSAFVADLAPASQAEAMIGAGFAAAHASGASTSDAEISIEAQIAAYRDAHDEATAALRVVQGMGQQIGLPEVHAYVAALNAALAATPGHPTPEQARLFSHWLRGARTQLLDKAGSFHTWITAAELLDPEGGPHAVPSRFVRWQAPSEDAVLEEAASRFRVRRSLANFSGDDADSAPGRA